MLYPFQAVFFRSICFSDTKECVRFENMLHQKFPCGLKAPPSGGKERLTRRRSRRKPFLQFLPSGRGNPHAPCPSAASVSRRMGRLWIETCRGVRECPLFMKHFQFEHALKGKALSWNGGGHIPERRGREACGHQEPQWRPAAWSCGMEGACGASAAFLRKAQAGAGIGNADRASSGGRGSHVPRSGTG